MQISNVRSKKLARLSQTGDVCGITPTHVPRMLDVIVELRKAKSLKDIPSELNLHAFNQYKRRRLPSDQVLWSVKLTAQWRLVFRIDKDSAIRDLDYVQYH